MFVYSSGRGFNSARFNGGGGIGCLIFGVIGMVAAYFILKGLFKLLYWASPVLFVLALIINWRAVVDTLKNWLKTMETSPVSGLISAALAVLLFPVFALFLFVKALGYSKIEQMKREFGTSEVPSDDFVEFEELESMPKGGMKTEKPPESFDFPEIDPEPPAPVPPKGKNKGQNGDKKQPEPPRTAAPEKPENPYDQLFDN